MTDWFEKLPHDLWSLQLLTHGISGMVRVVDDNTVIKHPLGGEDNVRDHFIERRIYERLGQHPRIVKLISFHRECIVLERLKYPLRQRFLDLQASNELPSTEHILRWSKQAAEGLQYLHAKNVFQTDIGTHNLLLDVKDNIKFCDFAGSSIDSEKAWVCPNSHAEYPFTGRKTYQPTIDSELFSLGAVIYEISTTWRPYDGKSDREVENLYAAGVFPETEYLLLGQIIRKCWTSQYKDAGEAVAEIEQVQRLMDQGQLHKLDVKVEKMEKGDKCSVKDAQGLTGGLLFTSAVFILATVVLLALRTTRHPAAAANA